MRSMGLNVITTASGTVLDSGGMPYSDIAVVGVTTVYTKSYPVSRAGFFGLFYYANSALAAIKLKIEVETSFKLPTTEGAADTYYVEPVNQPDIVAALETEGTLYHYSLPIPPCRYLRFRINGLTGNADDTILNLWLCEQEA